MATNVDTSKLRNMLQTPGCDPRCFLNDGTLSCLLDRYPCFELAAYHACLIMAQHTGMRLSDGTAAPDQSRYWLMRALEFRTNGTRALRRADEAAS